MGRAGKTLSPGRTRVAEGRERGEAGAASVSLPRQGRICIMFHSKKIMCEILTYRRKWV